MTLSPAQPRAVAQQGGDKFPLQLNACKCYWNWWQLLMHISRQRAETMSWNLLSSAHKGSVARFPKGWCFTYSPFVPLVIHNSRQLDKTLAEMVLRSHNKLHRELAFPFISKWHTGCYAQKPSNSYLSQGKLYHWRRTLQPLQVSLPPLCWLAFQAEDVDITLHWVDVFHSSGFQFQLYFFFQNW